MDERIYQKHWDYSIDFSIIFHIVVKNLFWCITWRYTGLVIISSANSNSWVSDSILFLLMILIYNYYWLVSMQLDPALTKYFFESRDYIFVYQKRSAIFTSTLNLTRDVKYFSGHICQTNLSCVKTIWLFIIQPKRLFQNGDRVIIMLFISLKANWVWL
jgi:hypothetical protein